MGAEGSKAGPIPLRRLLPGVLLHVCAPAYLLACLATCLLVRPVVGDAGDVAARMLWTAAWFVPGLLGVTAASAGVGALLDRGRPRAPDKAAEAQARLAAARRLFDGLHHPRLARLVAAMDAAAWDWTDARQQRIAGDLEAAARTFYAAAGSATAERRGAILELAADSVERLCDALAELGEERRRLDEGDARTVARYLDARYR